MAKKEKPLLFKPVTFIGPKRGRRIDEERVKQIPSGPDIDLS
jgi:hypothetical protein